MKRIIVFAGVLLIVSKSFAQKPPTYSGDDKPAKGGFKTENIFVGGSIGLGYAGYTFSAGANPEIGYSVAQWLDAGISVNLNYTSERADPYGYYNNNTRYRAFNYGAGVFARIYPVNFLFIQLQPENNWIHYTAKDFNTGESGSNTVQASSFIAGIGYSQRVISQGSYFLMVGLDLANNRNSPYRDAYTGANIPIVRAGFDFYLNASRRK